MIMPKKYDFLHPLYPFLPGPWIHSPLRKSDKKSIIQNSKYHRVIQFLLPFMFSFKTKMWFLTEISVNPIIEFQDKNYTLVAEKKSTLTT